MVNGRPLTRFVLSLCGGVTLSAVVLLLFMCMFALAMPGRRSDLADAIRLLVVIVAIGTLVMIAHLNLTRSLDDGSKAKWRRYLPWGGPVTAGLYLLVWIAGDVSGDLLSRWNHWGRSGYLHGFGQP
jgi:hypothetical protein